MKRALGMTLLSVVLGGSSPLRAQVVPWETDPAEQAESDPAEAAADETAAEPAQSSSEAQTQSADEGEPERERTTASTPPEPYELDPEFGQWMAFPLDDPVAAQGWLRCTDADAAQTPVGLTIRGAASMGAWEAGATWALMTAMRRSGTRHMEGWCPMELRVASGTSAGSVNAVLAGMEWLAETDSRVGVDRFWRTWLPVDVELLLPTLADEDPGIEYRADDAIFARDAFSGATQFLEESMSGLTSEGFLERTVDVVVTMTRLVPETHIVANVETRSQRDVVGVRLSGRPDRVDLFQFPIEHAGRQLFTIETPDGTISPDFLVRSLYASMAFPIAFGAMEIGYYPEPIVCEEHHASSCEEEPLVEWFVDGGVFDDAPISVAVSVMESEPAVEGVDWHYIYVDPAHTRFAAAAPTEQALHPQSPGAIAPFLTLMQGALETGRQYELLSLFRNVEFDESGARSSEAGRQLHVLGRGYGNVGIQVLWFAALFDEAFRRFDYAVGVYDAMHFLAQERCVASVQPFRCTFETLGTLHDAMGFGEETVTARMVSDVYRRLMLWEFSGYGTPAQREWMQTARSDDDAVMAVFAAFDPRVPLPPPTQRVDGLFAGLVTQDGTAQRMAIVREALALRGASVATAFDGGFGARFVRDPYDAIRDFGTELSARAVAADFSSDLPDRRRSTALTMSRALALAADIEQAAYRDGFELDPTSVPRGRFHWTRALPHTIDVGLVDPILRLRYRPTWYRGGYGLGFPVDGRFSISPSFSDASIGVAPLIWRTRNSLISEISVSTTWSVRSISDDGLGTFDNFFAEVGIFAFENRFRLGIGYGNDGTQVDRFGGKLYSIRVGFSDVGGTLFHLLRRR